MNKVRQKKTHCRHEKKLLLKRVCRQEQALKQASDVIFNRVGQDLSLAKLHLATSHVEQPVAEKERISNSHELVSKAIKDLRQLGNQISEAMEAHWLQKKYA
jgi:hypothetical protein